MPIHILLIKRINELRIKLLIIQIMEQKYFAESELIINPDGSVFHLHLKPEHLADKVILVGDPGRVSLVASHFDRIEDEVSSREFRTVTGFYKNKRITVQSTGIGCDNIDIVMNELDALANIDFSTRLQRSEHRTLNIVRIGTCGGLQPECPIGTFVASVKSIGFDGLLNFYAGRDEASDLEYEEEFKKQVNWNMKMGNPYVACSDTELLDRIAADDMVRGITIACGGFFGPQGRELRLPLMDPKLNEKIEAFEYKGLKINNFEMESSALSGLSTLMGHKATTVCMVIANRLAKEANAGYKNSIDTLIEKVLERI
jgi:uridine phosphorylase